MPDLNLANGPPMHDKVGPGHARLARMARSLTLLAALIAATAIPAMRVSAQAASMTGGVRAGQYRIQAGDLLQYRVWPNTEASGEFPVESSGLVYLPLAGAVPVGGKTLDEVRATLRDLYARAVQGATQPVVTVTAIFPFSVIGDVSRGGIYDGRAGMTVFDAVSHAGGFRTDERPKQLSVVHADGASMMVDATDEAMSTVLLQSQDRVVVPTHRSRMSVQSLLSLAQLAIGLVTIVKVF
jgi:protein involved in polysaccharide export with SLBB domain